MKNMNVWFKHISQRLSLSHKVLRVKFYNFHTVNQRIGNAFNFANKNYFKGYNSSKTMLKVSTFFDFKFPISEIKDEFLGLRYFQCNSIEIMLKLVFFLQKMLELNELRRSKILNAFSTQCENWSVALIFAKIFLRNFRS